MKIFHKTLLLFFALLLSATGTIDAQKKQSDSEATKVIIITKQMDDDGNEVVKKEIKEGEEAEEYLSGNGLHLEGAGGKNLDIDIQVFRSANNNSPIGSEGDGESMIIDLGGDNANNQIDIVVDQAQGQKRIRIKSIDEDGESFDIDWNGEGEIPAEIQEKINKIGCQESPPQRTRRMMGGHHGCDKGFLGVILKEKSVILNGVRQNPEDEELGVHLSDIVAGSAAEAAGIQSSDIITSINGQTVNTADELTREIQNNKVGEQIKIGLLRNGTALEVAATLKAREHRSKGARSFHWDSDPEGPHSFGDRSDFKVKSCKPFIGVYLNLGDSEETELSVRRIIPNTPADEVNLQIGDVITAIDQIEVKSHDALIVERDKHQAGDQFTLSYLRDGVSQTVNATFPACAEKTILSDSEVIIIEEEEKEISAEEVLPNDPFLVPESSLSLTNFSSFPNPTEGLVNLRFAAESKPTIITVTDISGREVFRETLNTFDGIYNQQIDLSNVSDGTLLLKIQQEDQIFSDKIILKKND